MKYVSLNVRDIYGYSSLRIVLQRETLSLSLPGVPVIANFYAVVEVCLYLSDT